MTVERQDSASFLATKEQIVAAILRVLSKGQKTYSYVSTSVDEDTGEIRTTVWPKLWPLFVSTELRILVKPQGKRTTVTARTRSQFFIMGDVFDYYRQYISELIRSLTLEVSDSSPPETSNG